MDRRYMFMKKMFTGDCLPLPLPWGYIHVYDHNVQTSSSLKRLGQNQKAYDFETWHEASEGGALQSLYKS